MNDVIGRVRRFNRFYTEQIGVLTEHLLRSDFSLVEVRILYEICHRDRATAARIAADLGLDRGYMSRIVTRFEQQGLLERTTSPDDARARILELTSKGRRSFRTLDARANGQIELLLRPASAGDRQRLLGAMRTIEQVLAPERQLEEQAVLRDPRAGDLGWIVHRHGVLYRQEYGYDERFEALVAKIVGEFVEQLDARRERCWIAEHGGEVVGSVFLVRGTDTVAKLRLLYVEPRVRGRGLGERLIDACIRFARLARYRKIVLWTQGELLAARHLYARAGFAKIAEEPHASFGRDDLVAETWEPKL